MERFHGTCLRFFIEPSVPINWVYNCTEQNKKWYTWKKKTINELDYMWHKGHSSFQEPQEALMLPDYTQLLIEDHSHVSGAVLLQENELLLLLLLQYNPLSKREQSEISAIVDVDIFLSWIILLTPEFMCRFLRLWISIFWAVLGERGRGICWVPMQISTAENESASAGEDD